MGSRKKAKRKIKVIGQKKIASLLRHDESHHLIRIKQLENHIIDLESRFQQVIRASHQLINALNY